MASMPEASSVKLRERVVAFCETGLLWCVSARSGLSSRRDWLVYRCVEGSLVTARPLVGN